MKTSIKLTIAAIAVVGLVATGYGLHSRISPVVEIAKPSLVSDEDQKLGQYVVNAMYASYSGRKLTDGHKLVLARSIVRVANDIFDTLEQRKAFVIAIDIESGFQRFAQSPTGPKGLTQVARATFHEAMADCGVENLVDEDVWDTDLNLYAGACYFRKMIELAPEHDPGLATVFYNQGPFDASAKTFAKTGNLDKLEPLKYIAKFSFLNKTTKDTKQPGTPSINDLPGVKKPFVNKSK